MNAVFELEVNSFRKPVKDFACLTSVGKYNVPRNRPAVAEAISIVIGSWDLESREYVPRDQVFPLLVVYCLLRLALDNIEWSQIGHFMNFTQRIIFIMERDWNVPEAEETKPTERPLWREHSRELSTDL